MDVQISCKKYIPLYSYNNRNMRCEGGGAIRVLIFNSIDMSISCAKFFVFVICLLPAYGQYIGLQLRSIAIVPAGPYNEEYIPPPEMAQVDAGYWGKSRVYPQITIDNFSLGGTLFMPVKKAKSMTLAVNSEIGTMYLHRKALKVGEYGAFLCMPCFRGKWKVNARTLLLQATLSIESSWIFNDRWEGGFGIVSGFWMPIIKIVEMKMVEIEKNLCWYTEKRHTWYTLQDTTLRFYMPLGIRGHLKYKIKNRLNAFIRLESILTDINGLMRESWNEEKSLSSRIYENQYPNPFSPPNLFPEKIKFSYLMVSLGFDVVIKSWKKSNETKQ